MNKLCACVECEAESNRREEPQKQDYVDALDRICNLVQWNRPVVDGFTLAHEIQGVLETIGYKTGPT